MPIPTQAEIDLPLLEAILSLGGEARPRDVYPILAKSFPDMTDADMAETLLHGESKWKNRVQWARQDLVSSGELDSPKWGLWRITALGRQRVQGKKGASLAPARARLFCLPRFRWLLRLAPRRRNTESSSIRESGQRTAWRTDALLALTGCGAVTGARHGRRLDRRVGRRRCRGRRDRGA
jgi:restriction endonuclease Mrr